ncbi:MAG: acetoin utilization protein AcuC [Thermodesulfobacteriota bacterium]
MKTVFIYSDEFGRYDYGNEHPMKPVRLRLTYELIKGYGLLDLPGAQLVEGRKAEERELLLFHTADYIDVLKDANDGTISPVTGLRYALGMGDNPVFTGVYDWSLSSAGASVQAAELILGGEADIAFNICGGLHHAMRERAAGFCYLNDGAIAIQLLVNAGRRIAYIDIDAHHGDGVQTAFFDTDRVLTISLHESGHHLFPGTGFPDEIGTGDGYGFSINLPFPPGADDDSFADSFDQLIPPLLDSFKPDVLVTQLGVDTFRSDPITHLNLTTNGFERMVKSIKGFRLPWIALGGGGYDIGNVARAWTLAWAIMNDREAEDGLPTPFREMAEEFGISGSSLRDRPFGLPGNVRGAMRAESRETIERLLTTVVPLLGRR